MILLTRIMSLQSFERNSNIVFLFIVATWIIQLSCSTSHTSSLDSAIAESNNDAEKSQNLSSQNDADSSSQTTKNPFTKEMDLSENDRTAIETNKVDGMISMRDSFADDVLEHQDYQTSHENILETMKCEKVGDRRSAKPEEFATYCLCEEKEWQGQKALFWSCYGPDLQKNDSETEVYCENFFIHQGSLGSCLAMWTECIDMSQYSVSCVDGSCLCLENGIAKANIESMDCCPRTVKDVNELCGWMLKTDSNKSAVSSQASGCE